MIAASATPTCGLHRVVDRTQPHQDRDGQRGVTRPPSRGRHVAGRGRRFWVCSVATCHGVVVLGRPARVHGRRTTRRVGHSPSFSARTDAHCRAARAVGRSDRVGQVRAGPRSGRSGPSALDEHRVDRPAPRRGRLAESLAGRPPGRGRCPRRGSRRRSASSDNASAADGCELGSRFPVHQERVGPVRRSRRCAGGCRSPPRSPRASPGGASPRATSSSARVRRMTSARLPSSGQRWSMATIWSRPSTSSPQRRHRSTAQQVWASRAASRSPVRWSCSAPNSRTVSSIR